MNSKAVTIPFLDLMPQFESIREKIMDAVDRVFVSGQFVGGEWVERFEEQFARFVGSRYAIGVGSGTAALELALKAAQIGVDDEVILPANSFFATAEAVSNVGARPVFADVDPTTSHLDVASSERLITARTRAIIPVHLYGWAMDMTALQKLADRHELTIIEDAAQAHGTERDGIPVGGSGRLTCFSFYPGKNLGAYGDAGVVTCDDEVYAERLRLLRDHGSPAKYVHVMIGTNSRLDALQAAVLSVKLRYLHEWNERRVQHAMHYAAKLRNEYVQVPEVPSGREHNFHLFVIRAKNRDALRQHLHARGIGTGIHYPEPLHLTPAYRELGYGMRGGLPVSEALAPEILSLPMYPELSESQTDQVIEAVLEFFDRFETQQVLTLSAAKSINSKSDEGCFSAENVFNTLPPEK
jgi:dTDP-4-amino-4,6-dideoxygalactose transaminase